jgi:phosphohistidine phosphatase
MRTLYLLRHAKSSWDDAELDDFDRPLAPRGADACARIAARMRSDGIEPGVVICSPARRAQETLAGLGDAIGAAAVELERDVYEATESDLLSVLRRVDPEVRSVMLIGHNPSIQRLALLLCAEGELLDALRAKFPTAALATLAVSSSEWRDLRMGDATLEAFVKPKELAAP